MGKRKKVKYDELFKSDTDTDEEVEERAEEDEKIGVVLDDSDKDPDFIDPVANGDSEPAGIKGKRPRGRPRKWPKMSKIYKKGIYQPKTKMDLIIHNVVLEELDKPFPAAE